MHPDVMVNMSINMDELLAWLKQRLQKRQNVFCELPSTITNNKGQKYFEKRRKGR